MRPRIEAGGLDYHIRLWRHRRSSEAGRWLLVVETQKDSSGRTEMMMTMIGRVALSVWGEEEDQKNRENQE